MIQMPTLVPADLPSPPSCPSRGRGDIHSGLVSWAGCLATTGMPALREAALVGCVAMSGQGEGHQGPRQPPSPEQDR